MNDKLEVESMTAENFSEYKTIAEATEGKVDSFGESEIRETSFGTRKVIPVNVVTKEGQEVKINLFLNPEKKTLHPKSNVYKLLRRAGVDTLNELIGKTVPVRIDQRGFYRFDV